MWVQLITAPLVGGLIGLVTNGIAVKMIFRPLKPVYIGRFRLPFTPGLIPKERSRIARAIGDTPVIFLTASADEYSVITGLDMGADDYISKPFRPRELLSRIKSVLRRSSKSNSVIEHGFIKVDTAKGTVTKNGAELFLSALEYRLLLVFLNNKGAILSRDKLLEEIYDIAGEYVNDNTLTVYIKRLRDKIEDDPQNPTFIKTVRGLGYKVGD